MNNTVFESQCGFNRNQFLTSSAIKSFRNTIEAEGFTSLKNPYQSFIIEIFNNERLAHKGLPLIWRL